VTEIKFKIIFRVLCAKFSLDNPLFVHAVLKSIQEIVCLANFLWYVIMYCYIHLISFTTKHNVILFKIQCKLHIHQPWCYWYYFGRSFSIFNIIYWTSIEILRLDNFTISFWIYSLYLHFTAAFLLTLNVINKMSYLLDILGHYNNYVMWFWMDRMGIKSGFV
jgi:hypothetical protein